MSELETLSDTFLLHCILSINRTVPYYIHYTAISSMIPRHLQSYCRVVTYVLPFIISGLRYSQIYFDKRHVIQTKATELDSAINVLYFSILISSDSWVEKLSPHVC